MSQRGMGIGSPRLSDWSMGEAGGGDASTPALPLPSKEAKEDGGEDEDANDAFNTFRFWQLPILDLEAALPDDEIQAVLTSLDVGLLCLVLCIMIGYYFLRPRPRTQKL